MEFDKKSGKALALEVEKELAALGERMGLKIQYVGGTLEGSRMVLKLSFEEEGVDKGAEDFKKHAVQFGLKVEDLGAEIQMGGRRFVIAGLKTTGKGSQSAPVIATDRANGKNYLLRVKEVKGALGREVKAWEKNC
jgi:hypothetical protein